MKSRKQMESQLRHLLDAVRVNVSHISELENQVGLLQGRVSTLEYQLATLASSLVTRLKEPKSPYPSPCQPSPFESPFVYRGGPTSKE